MSKHIIYRTYRNTDIPGLTRIWNEVKSPDYLPLKTNFSEIVSSLLFDPEDFFVAVETDDELPRNFMCDGTVVGFIHGGYGPKEDGQTFDYSVGTIAMLRVLEREDREEIAQNLLERLEKHFISRGAKKIYAGAVYPHAPFYMPLLSTGELHGIIQSSTFAIDLMRKNHYELETCFELYRIDITRSIPSIRKEIMTVVNRCRVEYENAEKASQNWWNRVAYQEIERKFSVIRMPENDEIRGSAESHLFTPTVRSPEEERIAKENRVGTRSVFATVYSLYVKPEYRNSKIGQGLIDGILDQLHREGCKFVELQVPSTNEAAKKIFTNFKFTHFSNSYLLCKVLE